MEDNVLKKEFSKKDVNRLRNLVKKDFNGSVSTQIGYSKAKEFHAEGDIWEENNKTWTIKEGIRQNITKLDAFKKLSQMPLVCPKCKNPMKSENVKIMYKIHGMCLNCVVDFEMSLKLKGKYEEYERAFISGNIKSFLKDYEAFINNAISNHNSSFVTEDGDIEVWKGKIDKEKILSNTQEFINKGNEYLNNQSSSVL